MWRTLPHREDKANSEITATTDTDGMTAEATFRISLPNSPNPPQIDAPPMAGNVRWSEPRQII